MNSDGKCCYTEDEYQDMDWRETGVGNQVEWFFLLDPSRTTIAPPCNHDSEECPAKKKISNTKKISNSKN